MNRLEFVGNVLSEIVPIATFVIVSELYDFTTGIRALMVTAFFAVALSWYIEKRIPKFGLFASGIILFFGALSLLFHNPFFIIIKDTLYYATFSLALVVGLFIGRSPFQVFFEDYFAMSERGWRMLSLRWAFFFAMLTIGNEVVRHLYTPDQWVLYKFCALLLTWVFGFYQFRMIRRERLPEANKWGLRIREKHL